MEAAVRASDARLGDHAAPCAAWLQVPIAFYQSPPTKLFDVNSAEDFGFGMDA